MKNSYDLQIEGLEAQKQIFSTLHQQIKDIKYDKNNIDELFDAYEKYLDSKIIRLEPYKWDNIKPV